MTTTRCRYWINSDTSGLLIFVEFRCILFLDTSESDGFGASRCIIALVSVGDTSGLRFQFPSRCMETQIYLHNTSGWANTGYFRCIANNRQNKIHRNSKFSSNPDVSQLISREYTCFLSQSAPAQAGFTMICAEICFRWQYVASRGAYFDRFRGMDTSGLLDFMEFRCILFWDTSESDVFDASRCIWNIWFYAHTSEMPDLGPFRCIVTLVSVGDTSGLRIQFPSRCT